MIDEDKIKIVIDKSIEAIAYLDDTRAVKLIQEIVEAFSQDLENKNPQLFQELQSILGKLRIVAFPSLDDDECVDILMHDYLQSFEEGISMENRITAKLFFIPYVPRDELREQFQRALSKNDEKIGELEIGTWIKEYEKMHNVSSRDISASVRFVYDHPQARTLNEADKEKIKEILHVYDHLLVSTLPATGPILNQILSSSSAPVEEQKFTPYIIVPVRSSEERDIYPELRSESVAREKETSRRWQPEKRSIGSEKLAISEALEKYPDLGEQPISANKINIKLFPDPAKPSIKNWITDYRYALGAGSHGTMERGNYLYHGENTKGLTAGERQRLAVILKSLDENEPVVVDGDKQEIVFQKLSTDSLQQPADEKIAGGEFPTYPVWPPARLAPKQTAEIRERPVPPPASTQGQGEQPEKPAEKKAVDSPFTGSSFHVKEEVSGPSEPAEKGSIPPPKLKTSDDLAAKRREEMGVISPPKKTSAGKKTPSQTKEKSDYDDGPQPFFPDEKPARLAPKQTAEIRERPTPPPASTQGQGEQPEKPAEKKAVDSPFTGSSFHVKEEVSGPSEPAEKGSIPPPKLKTSDDLAAKRREEMGVSPAPPKKTSAGKETPSQTKEKSDYDDGPQPFFPDEKPIRLAPKQTAEIRERPVPPPASTQGQGEQPEKPAEKKAVDSPFTGSSFHVKEEVSGPSEPAEKGSIPPPKLKTSDDLAAKRREEMGVISPPKKTSAGKKTPSQTKEKSDYDDGPQPFFPDKQPKFKPYRIYPMGYGPAENGSKLGEGNKEPKVNGNVVDLRG